MGTGAKRTEWPKLLNGKLEKAKDFIGQRWLTGVMTAIILGGGSTWATWMFNNVETNQDRIESNEKELAVRKKAVESIPEITKAVNRIETHAAVIEERVNEAKLQLNRIELMVRTGFKNDRTELPDTENKLENGELVIKWDQ